MDIYKLSVAGINVNEGVKRFSGAVSLYEKYLMKFPDDENFGKMCEALSAKDTQTAFKYAHALKGLAGNLSLQSLYDAVYPLVEQLRNGNVEYSPALLVSVTETYKTIVNAITEQE